MSEPRYLSFEDKLIISFASAVIFAVLSSPRLFAITGDKTRKYGWETSSVNGCPFVAGILIHSILFMLLVLIMMLDNLLIGGILIAMLFGLLYLI
jgi:energy-converting hydrogenase Eha subunit A